MGSLYHHNQNTGGKTLSPFRRQEDGADGAPDGRFARVGKSVEGVKLTGLTSLLTKWQVSAGRTIMSS